jgi:hypothetical protein
VTGGESGIDASRPHEQCNSLIDVGRAPSSANGSRLSSLVYFSHSYRQRDAVVNNYFARLMESEGLVASLDPPSINVNSAKLERHLGSCEALIAVLTQREDGVSPHVMYEISLGLRSGRPVLVFVEDTLPPDVLPPYVLQRRFSARWFPRSVREYRQALTVLRSHIGSSVPRLHGLSPRTCLLLGTSTLEPEIAAAVEQHIRQVRRYEVVTSTDLIADIDRHPIAYGQFREFSLVVAFLEPDHDRDELFLLGGVQSTFVPTISFVQQRSRHPDNSVPAEYRERLLDPSSDPTSLRELISSEIETYEADFLDLQDEASADRYTQFLIDLDSHGRFTSRTTERALEVVMGDRYEVHGQVGAVGPNSHVHDVTLQQTWIELSDQIDLPTLASELSRLRIALRERATTIDDDKAVAEIAQAEIAAQHGDGPGALRNLKKAGRWALDIALSIGVDVATGAIKVALGLP